MRRRRLWPRRRRRRTECRCSMPRQRISMRSQRSRPTTRGGGGRRGDAAGEAGRRARVGPSVVPPHRRRPSLGLGPPARCGGGVAGDRRAARQRHAIRRRQRRDGSGPGAARGARQEEAAGAPARARHAAAAERLHQHAEHRARRLSAPPGHPRGRVLLQPDRLLRDGERHGERHVPRRHGHCHDGQLEPDADALAGQRGLLVGGVAHYRAARQQ